MTGTELHDALNLARLVGTVDGIGRVFHRCREFPGLIRRLAFLGPQLVREGRITTLVRVRRGMSRREFARRYLDRLLEVDGLTRLPRFVVRSLGSAGLTCESTNPISLN